MPGHPENTWRGLYVRKDRRPKERTRKEEEKRQDSFAFGTKRSPFRDKTDRQTTNPTSITPPHGPYLFLPLPGQLGRTQFPRGPVTCELARCRGNTKTTWPFSPATVYVRNGPTPKPGGERTAPSLGGGITTCRTFREHREMRGVARGTSQGEMGGSHAGTSKGRREPRRVRSRSARSDRSKAMPVLT